MFKQPPPPLPSNGNTTPQMSGQLEELRINPVETPRVPVVCVVETPQPSPAAAPQWVSPSVPGPSRDAPRQMKTGASLKESSSPGGGKYVKQAPSLGAMATPGEAVGRVIPASLGELAVPPPGFEVSREEIRTPPPSVLRQTNAA